MKKKIFVVWIVIVLSMVLLSGCSQQSGDDNADNDELQLVSHDIETKTGAYGISTNSGATMGYGEYKEVTGTIKNIADETIDQMTIKVQFYDSDNELLLTRSVPSNSINSLAKDETADFSVVYGADEQNYDRYDHYTISLSWGDKTTGQSSDDENQEDTQNDEEPELTQEQIDALNSQVENLLQSVTEREGFSCSISISQTEFMLGEPLIQREDGAYISGLDYNCAFSISMGKYPKTYRVLGYYNRNNVDTFKGSASWSDGTTAAHGYGGSWKVVPAGGYYLYYGIYNATLVDETLNTNPDDATGKEIFLNIQPEVYSRVSINVSEEVLDCESFSSPNMCWQNVAKAAQDCSYCENIGSDFLKSSCYNDC